MISDMASGDAEIAVEGQMNRSTPSSRSDTESSSSLLGSKEIRTEETTSPIEQQQSSNPHDKPCTMCGTPRGVLVRCQIDETGKWHFVCPGKCWRAVSGGEIDARGHKEEFPHYKYGGMWKNKHEDGPLNAKKPKKKTKHEDGPPNPRKPKEKNKRQQRKQKIDSQEAIQNIDEAESGSDV